eukprot:TRINITY_DN27000_c0_g1_i2.p1 TRINITY_DN27000_c0_g1~~TRINITY_DN27000_c0_g1_i2.p1  ORF type:complete len:214 (-),score=45.55 TRINITY_DN27000_c0_g1_i2:158-799(-)
MGLLRGCVLLMACCASALGIEGGDTHLQMLWEERQIEQAFRRYASAVDTADWEAYREVFTEDATIDYSAAGGNAGTVPEIADWLSGIFPGVLVNSQHAVSNFDISFEGATSADQVPTHANARVLFDNPNNLRFVPWPQPFFRCGGWYVARLKRVQSPNEKATWKIDHLEEEIAYSTVVPSLLMCLGLLCGGLRSIWSYLAVGSSQGKVKAKAN